MKKLTFLLLLLSLSVMANLHQAPPDFIHQGKKAIFVDFQNAEYNIVFNKKKKSVKIVSTIEFEAQSTGYPIFDLKTEPSSVSINGLEAGNTLITDPDGLSNFRIANSIVTPGTYRLRIEHKLNKKAVKFGRKGVNSAFLIKDLTARKFLEQYLPTNFEYDQYKMVFNVRVKGTKKHHNVFANGNVEELSPNNIRVTYPDYYGSSSVFFHLVPKSRFWRMKRYHKSIDGREIPVLVYSNFTWRNKNLMKRALEVLKELEDDYGPWPHDQVLIYGTGLRGGMEYCGATATSLISLGHELQHGYFAKGLIPADGNSGWMDEAIASWRDKGHLRLEKPVEPRTNLGAHSVYKRNTDDRSYKVGRSFIGYLDYRVHSLDGKGMKPFLKWYFERKKYQTVTTQNFIDLLNEYTGDSFDADFLYYVMSEESSSKVTIPYRKSIHHGENPHHPQYSQEELQGLI